MRRKIPQINHLKISINNSHQFKNSPLYTNKIHFNKLPLCAGFLSSLFFNNGYEQLLVRWKIHQRVFTRACIFCQREFIRAYTIFFSTSSICKQVSSNFQRSHGQLNRSKITSPPYFLLFILCKQLAAAHITTLQRQNTTIWSSQKC